MFCYKCWKFSKKDALISNFIEKIALFIYLPYAPKIFFVFNGEKRGDTNC